MSSRKLGRLQVSYQRLYMFSSADRHDRNKKLVSGLIREAYIRRLERLLEFERVYQVLANRVSRTDIADVVVDQIKRTHADRKTQLNLNHNRRIPTRRASASEHPPSTPLVSIAALGCTEEVINGQRFPRICVDLKHHTSPPKELLVRLQRRGRRQEAFARDSAVLPDGKSVQPRQLPFPAYLIANVS